MIYAIPDLHGRLDLLELALMNIERRKPGLVIFLGDYIDRGSHSKEVIERLMAGPPERWQWICLAGNHDLWFRDIIRHYEHPMEWLSDCGGDRTMASYGWERGGQIDRRLVPKEHLDWISSLPLYHETDHHVFVHAALDVTKPLEDQSETMLTWGYWRGRDIAFQGKYIVHGHDSSPPYPTILENRINLDTRAYVTNRLHVGVFDGPGKPIEIMEVKL